MKMIRSTERTGTNRPVDIAAARNDQRRQANAAIIARVKGIPAQEGNAETEADPMNPNAKPR